MRDMRLVNIHHDHVLVLFLVILLSSFMKVQLCGADQRLSNHHHDHKQDISSVKVVVDMNIGVIVDMGSSVNKVVLDCINMATKDYTLNGTTSANIILHTKDSKGDPFTAITIGEELRCNLSKFVIGVWLFVVFILASSYTAILSSILTVEQIQYAKGDYIGHVIGSHTQGTIVDNFNVADDKLRPYKSLEDFNDALSKGSKNGGVSAIIDETPYIKMFLAKYPHDHVMTDTSFTTNGIGFAFQKGSPLVSEISRAIAKLRQDGELARLEDKWFYQVNSESYRRDEQIKPETLSLDNFLGLFFVTGISKFIALFLFLIFFLRQRLFSNQHILKYLMEGRLGFIMKYLFLRMPNVIGGVLPR